MSHTHSVGDSFLGSSAQNRPSFVILKLSKGQEYSIEKTKFLSHCNKLSKKLEKVPEGKNIKILLPNWADDALFEQTKFHQILGLKHEDAVECMKEFKDGEVVQKMIYLAEICGLGGIKEVLVSQASSNITGKFFRNLI